MNKFHKRPGLFDRPSIPLSIREKVVKLKDNLNPVGLDNLGLVIYDDLLEKLERGVQLEDHDVEFVNCMYTLKFK